MSNNVTWTKEQLKAIEEKGCNLLVAAGAGSGKTAVLVERIISKVINQNIDIDNILVVTFTNSAASEMRERIISRLYKELETNPNIQKQLLLVNKANIMTIDSFCLKVIRDNFFKLDLDPNFRIGDETEIELLKLDALDELFEEKYEVQDMEFEELVNVYSSNKDDNYLKELVLQIHNFIKSSPYPQKWLEGKSEMYNIKFNDFSETIWGSFLIKYAKEEITGTIEELKELVKELVNYEFSEKHVIILNEDIFKLQAILNKCSKWDDIYNEISSTDFGRLPNSNKLNDEIKEKIRCTRDKMKDNIKKYLKDNIFISKSNELFEDMKIIYINLLHISNLVVDFDNKFKDKKREKNVLDFSDIEHLCLKLLDENSDIRNIYKDKYEEILIDEYQDSNLIQEYILTKISKDNMFMVGDVKQSIYRFRQARPELFLEKYNLYNSVSYEDDNIDKSIDIDRNSVSKKILLFKNFRSDKNIIDAINYIFKNIMSKDVGEIDYVQEEYLKFGAEYYLNEPESVEMHIIENNTKEDDESEFDEQNDNNEDVDTQINIYEDIEDKPQLEGRFIANRISEIVGSMDIYDKKTGNTKKAEYKDIVILLRSTIRYVDNFTQELSMRGIPVYAESNSRIF